MESNELVEKYKDLDIDAKRIELDSELMEMNIVMKRMLHDLKKDNSNQNKDNYAAVNSALSESEYLDNIFEKVIFLKEEIGEYLNIIVDNFYSDK